jgi:hypothetical protein
MFDSFGELICSYTYLSSNWRDERIANFDEFFSSCNFSAMFCFVLLKAAEQRIKFLI